VNNGPLHSNTVSPSEENVGRREAFARKSSMKRPLCVLIVEDCPDDTQLLLNELEREGFAPDWKRVQTEEEYLAHLGPHLDLVLSDHTLPGFSAPRALSLLRARGLEVPFIIVSGTIGEEVAVTTMRQGATDYVLKDRMKRLGAAVDHALEQARLARQRQEAEDALHSTHAQLRQLLDHSPAVIYALRCEGENYTPHLVSENITSLLGFTVSETLRADWWPGQLHVEDRQRAFASMAEILAKGTSTTEYRVHHKDGSVRWVEDKRRLVSDASGGPKEIVGIWTDITEKKRAEEVLAGAFDRERQARQAASARDLIVGIVSVVAIFALAYWLKIFTGPLELLVKYKETALDDLFGTLFVLSPLVFWFGYRRWKDSGAIILERQASARDRRIISQDWIGKLRSNIVKELAGLLILGVLMVVVGDYFDAFAKPFTLLWRYQDTVMDELIGTIVVLTIAAVPAASLFAYRRWFDIKSEAGEEQRTTLALQTLLAELDQRVQRGATDLAKTNEALRIKIAEHKRNGDVLRESERRFREMLENLEMIAMTLDKDGTVTFCNDYLLKVTGWRREEVIGSNWFSRFLPDNPQAKALFLETVENGNIPRHQENPILTRNGKLREIVWNNTMLRGTAGNFIGMASIGRDETERNRAEHALRDSEQRFRSFMQHSPIAGWIVDADGRFYYVSPGFERMFNQNADNLTGRTINDVYLPEVAAQYMANNDIVLREQRVLEAAEAAARPDGSMGEFMVVKFPMDGPEGKVLVGGIALDVTERKQLEQQFLRAQRMESIGTLAGGIAHDLNNSLGPILMSLDVLRMKFPDPDSRELLDLIQSSAQRSADMVRQVLSFGRGIEGRKMAVQVKHLLREIEKIVNDTFLKNIQVRADFPRDLCTVVGDPTQLHQVLLNLCVNARDAMPQGGLLSISAENLTLDAQYAALNPEAKPGRYVLIRVEDSGTGIPPEILEKIFDPFFTTKEVGKGTGLGLYTSLGIVKSHGGFVRVSSEVNQGTRFQVYIPADAAEVAEAASTETTLPRGAGETVLVVDDERIVREITRQTLETFGYRVVLACDGAEAVGKIASDGKNISVVVTDIAMPVMDGAAMIQVLRRFNPRLPVIVTSGQASKEQLAKIGGLEEKHVLAKPYTAEELLKTLKAALGQAR